MADLESTLSSILSDPDAMSKIMDLGKSLGLTDNNHQNTNTQKNEVPSTAPDLSSLSSLTSLIKGNPFESTSANSQNTAEIAGKLSAFLPLLSKMNQEDETTALLCALRPFLSEQRRKRLDDASKMLRLTRLLPFIRSAGLF